MKKILVIFSCLLFISIFPILCASQVNSINVTEEVTGTVPMLTWGANLWPGEGDNNMVYDGLPRSKITLGRIDMFLDVYIFKNDFSPPNFDILDKMIGAAKNNGKEPLIIVDYMPTWLARSGSSYDPPSNMTKFLELIENVINHIKDNVTYYEIWNEPSLSPNQYWTGTEIEYRDLLINVSQKIKSIDSDAVILAPALNNIDIQPGNKRFIYLREVCVNASDYFDIFSFHVYDYGNPGPPDRWPISMDYFRQLLNQYGCGNKPLWMTEAGFLASNLYHDYRDVLQVAKSRKVLLNYDVKAQVYFPFRQYSSFQPLYDSATKSFTSIGNYYQTVGDIKFYGDKLNIISDINDNVSEISFIAVRNEDNNIAVQITNSFSTNKELQVNFQNIRNLTVYESSSDQVFDYPNKLGYSSSLASTLKPYSVYLIEAKSASFVGISGQLNNAIQVDVTAYQTGTSNIVNSTSTVDGSYNLLLYPDLYDIKYSFNNFLPNFFIKLNSINIESNSQDLISNVANINNQNVSFIVDTDDNPTIQIHSSKKPSRVLINGTIVTEALSYSELANNTWYYDSNNLYVKGGCVCTGWTSEGCGSDCENDEQKQIRSCIPSDCSATSQCVYTPSCIAPTILFEDGFETGDFSKWSETYGSPKISTNSYAGAYSCEINASNNYPFKAFDNQTTVFVRGYFKFSQLPTSGQIRFLRLYYATGGWGDTIARTALEWVGAADSGRLTLKLEYYYPYSTYNSTPITMSANTWYLFEIKFVKHATNGEYRVWFNGNEVITVTGLNTSMSPDANRIYLTDYFSTSIPITVWTDSIVVSNSYNGLIL